MKNWYQEKEHSIFITFNWLEQQRLKTNTLQFFSFLPWLFECTYRDVEEKKKAAKIMLSMNCYITYLKQILYLFNFWERGIHCHLEPKIGQPLFHQITFFFYFLQFTIYPCQNHSSVNSICFKTENRAFLDNSYCMPCGKPIQGQYMTIQKQSDVKTALDAIIDVSEVDINTGTIKPKDQASCACLPIIPGWVLDQK